MFKRPVVTEIRLLSSGAAFEESAESLQMWYATHPEEYTKLRKKSGRAKWFEDAYKPVTVTACEGKVCGYVYFPCSEENGCSAVMDGSW